MTTRSANRPPMVQLEENGVPTVLSYNVPEPTSYSGKNYIDIPLPATAFTTLIATELAGASLLPQHADVGRQNSLDSLAHPALRLATDIDDEATVVVEALEPVTDRLAALTYGALRTMEQAGQRPVLYRASSGLLDVRTVSPATNQGASAEVVAQFMTSIAGLLPGGPVDPPEPPSMRVFLHAPARGATIGGPAAGVTLTVAGRWERFGGTGLPTITVTLDDGAPTEASVAANGTWTTQVTVTASGGHSLTAKGTTTAPYKGQTRVVSDTDSLTFAVALDVANPDPPPTLPSVEVSTPRDRTVVVAPTGIGTVTLSGTAASNVIGLPVSVEVVDTTTGAIAAASDVSGTWSMPLQLHGAGPHVIEVTAVSNEGRSGSVSLRLVVSIEEPSRRVLNRLMLVETLTLSSFLGAYGAGRVVRTFSLLPGERTTLSIKSFTRSSETSKNASSILDSAATEASDAFDDAISREQTDKRAESETQQYKIGAEVSAMWGFGSAKITGEYSGAANSAREEAVKNVTTATRKHAMKASSNRSITINTDYEVQREDKVEESTSREIANINVSRALNFTFRQLNQEHVVLVHLTNVRVAYYTEDVLLDADMQPMRDSQGKVTNRHSYREVSLPELQSLLEAAVVPEWHSTVRSAVVNVLTGIPDYQDILRAVVEEATPTSADGHEVPGAEYLRFPRNMTTTWKDPGSSVAFTVPGIILAWDKVVMRTDGVIVDSVLGHGDALDDYSHGLQDQAVEERRVANAAATASAARHALAVDIVRSKDTDMAELYAKVFPPPAPQTRATMPRVDTPTSHAVNSPISAETDRR